MNYNEIKKLKLYVDMDGVLVDFHKGAERLLGEPLTQENKKVFWKKLNKMNDSDFMNFWENLDWMPNGKKLWASVIKYDPIILSSPGFSKASDIKKAKEKWVNKHLIPSPTEVIFEVNKDIYADNNSILIDDLSKNIDPWRSKGGIGLLYTPSSLDTILKELKNIFNY